MDEWWIFETVFTYLNSQSFEDPLSKWISEHSKQFIGIELNETHTHEQYNLFKKYLKYTENMVGTYLIEIGIDQTNFFETCSLILEDKKTPIHRKSIISQILQKLKVVSEFENFKKLMVLFALQHTPVDYEPTSKGLNKLGNVEDFSLMSFEEQDTVFQPLPVTIPYQTEKIKQKRSYDDQIDEILNVNQNNRSDSNSEIDSATPDSLQELSSSDGETPVFLSTNQIKASTFERILPLEVRKEKNVGVKNLDDLLNAIEIENDNDNENNVFDGIMDLFTKEEEKQTNLNDELNSFLLKPIVSETPKLKAIKIHSNSSKNKRVKAHKR
eukprot:TRINITY_DN2092_c0_g1_i1.p1 TRINITY_DN2092_c0_g1~~TRINITY_DN2092_c0_g1_i1.p1  ORF type:complete len:336 (+),score=94.37 TRINITY_DN2092_c0_g1_i1:28-1008(+)